MILVWVLVLFLATIFVSQSAMDFFSMVLVMTMLWMGWKWKEQQSQNKVFVSAGWDWLFVVWFLVVGVSFYLQGFVGQQTLLKLIEFKWIFVFYMLVSAIKYLEITEEVILPTSIFLSILSAYGILIWFLKFDPINPTMELEKTVGGLTRTGGLNVSPTLYAQLLSLPFIVLFGVFLSYFRWRQKGVLWLSICLIFVGTAIGLSFSYGVWIALMLSALVMIFIYNWRWFFIYISGVIVSVGSALVLSASLRHRLFSLIHEANDKIWMLRANFQMIQEHPFFGVGYDENSQMLEKYYEKVGAPKEFLHLPSQNQFIHMTAGTGSVGLVVFVTIYIYFLYLAFRVWSQVNSRNTFHQGLAIGLIGAQFTFLFTGFFDTNFEYPAMKFLISLVWAITVWLAYEYRILREDI